jgi:hypothetical protein
VAASGGGEEAEGLDVEDEVRRACARPTSARFAVVRYRVVARVDLPPWELLRVEAQALFGRLAGGGVEAGRRRSASCRSRRRSRPGCWKGPLD